MQAFYTSIIIVFLKGLRFQDSIAVLNPWIERLNHSPNFLSKRVEIAIENNRLKTVTIFFTRNITVEKLLFDFSRQVLDIRPTVSWSTGR